MEIDVKKALNEFEKIELRRCKELREAGKEIERMKKELDELVNRIDKLLTEHYLFLCGKWAAGKCASSSSEEVREREAG